MKTTKAKAWNYRDYSIDINIPPLGMVAFKYDNIVKPKVKTSPKKKLVKKAKAKTKSK
jgi:1,4-alpha-glucan branching enzyme